MGLVTAVLLLSLQYCDLRYRRLPNRLVAVYVLLCPLVLLANGVPAAAWLQHSAVALVGFAILTLSFVMGGMGGGDVKLGTAVLAWSGLQSLLAVLFVVGSVGLILAILGVIADRLAVVGSGTGTGSVSRVWRTVLYCVSAKRGVPYGVALAAGGMAALPAWW